jgi:CRISPR-associated protein Csb2
VIAIKLRFLAGRFHSTPWGRHVNEGIVEWPPSPWRLLRALIAVSRRARPDGVTEDHLRRLVEALSAPPQFYLPPAATAQTRHYDEGHGKPKQKPDGGWKVEEIPFFFDTFVVVAPDKSVFCVWPEVKLDEEDRRALGALLDAMNTFGRAESWCEAALVNGESLIGEKCAPLAAGEALNKREPVRVLLPDATADNLLEKLTIEISDMRAQKMLTPPGARWVTYARSSNALTPRRAAPRRQPALQATITVARYALDSTVLPLIQDTLIFAELARIEVLRQRGGVARNAAKRASHSEALTGKAIDGTPLEGHEHAHYLPTDEDGDGRLDHLTIWAPMGFSAEDQEALGSLTTVKRRQELPEVWLTLAALGTAEELAALEEPPPLFRSSARWRSVTPFSLPRFANRGAGKPPRPRDKPEAQLKRELRLRDKAEPIQLIALDGRERSKMRCLEFHTRRLKDGEQGFGLAGFELEFAEDVPGPLVLGFGCHFGLGLFLPIE